MTTPIRAALIDGSSLEPLVCGGLQALERPHLRDHVHAAIKAEFADSLDIDKAFAAQHPSANRWDYLMGHTASGELVALEPHSATSGQISTVIAKLGNAKQQLSGHLRPGKRVSHWYWVASGKVDFVPLEKAKLRILNAGITFVGGMLLATHLPRAKPKPPPKGRSAKKPGKR